MKATAQQELFETKAGMELISAHFFNEDNNTVWFLRIVAFKGSGRKSWVMWCERNGVEVQGTRRNGKNITNDIKSIFSL